MSFVAFVAAAVAIAQYWDIPFWIQGGVVILIPAAQMIYNAAGRRVRYY
jgi:hypothetical protein